MTAASLQALGRHEFSARLPAALASWRTVLVRVRLGSRLFGSRSAFYGSILLLLSLGFVCRAAS